MITGVTDQDGSNMVRYLMREYCPECRFILSDQVRNLKIFLLKYYLNKVNLFYSYYYL